MAAGALVLAVWIGVNRWADADRFERRIARALSGPERSAEVSVGRAEVRLLRRGVRLDSVSVALTARSGSRGRSAAIDVAEAALEGVSLLGLAFDGELRGDQLRLQGLSVVASGRPHASSPPEGWERVRIEGVHLRLRDVSVGGGAGRFAFGGAGRLSVDRYRARLPGGLHGLEVRGVTASTAGDSARLDSLRIEPLWEEDRFFDRLAYAEERVTAVSGPIRVRGVDVPRLLRRSGLVARRIDVASPKITVFSDERLPPRPGGPPPRMPAERLRSLATLVTVDTVAVDDGRVEYSERTDASSRPGRVSFEGIRAVFREVTNDSSRAAPGHEAVVRASARLYGAAPLELELRFPLFSPGLDLSFSGELGEMDLRSFNDMFLPVEGIRIESGRLERLDFDGRVRDGAASGSVRARYRDLEVDKVDPESGGQSLGDLVQSLIMDGKIADRNPPSDDADPKVGTIDHRRQPGAPFFGFLWASLRSGLLSLVSG